MSGQAGPNARTSAAGAQWPSATPAHPALALTAACNRAADDEARAEKAQAVAFRHPTCLVLGADTVVGCGRRILPKADDEATARRCLELLSGRRHRVHGGVALAGPGAPLASRRVQTAVVFKRLSGAEIDWYLASGEWRGKAGGYAIQGLAARFVREIVGSYSNVVGLPLFETTQLLVGRGARA